MAVHYRGSSDDIVSVVLKLPDLLLTSVFSDRPAWVSDPAWTHHGSLNSTVHRSPTNQLTCSTKKVHRTCLSLTPQKDLERCEKY